MTSESFKVDFNESKQMKDEGLRSQKFQLRNIQKKHCLLDAINLNGSANYLVSESNFIVCYITVLLEFHSSVLVYTYRFLSTSVVFRRRIFMYEEITQCLVLLRASRNLDISGYCLRKNHKNQRLYVRYLYTIKSERNLSGESQIDQVNCAHVNYLKCLSQIFIFMITRTQTEKAMKYHLRN